MDFIPSLAVQQIGGGVILLTVIVVFVAFAVLISVLARIKKCPSDRIMVIYGSQVFHRDKATKHAARCIHGGTAFIWPVIQDYGFLSLRPIQLEVNLRNALCKQNIRINVPSVFTVGVSTDETLMGNAANRLLGLQPDAIGELAKDIIFGQLRLVIASMTIEQINSDRETFLRSIEQNVAEELNKIGLLLLNVNITDITDESGYIDAIGKRAASEAINKARIEVAEEERKGGIGEAEARKAQRIAVSQAEAEAQAGEANADRERRIAVTQAEAQAQSGEADADKQRRIAIKQAEAEAQIGEANADKERRISIKQAEALAIEGENVSAIEIAKSNATRAENEADAYRQAEAAKRIAEAKIKQADYEAEMLAQIARAKMPAQRWRPKSRRPKRLSMLKLKRNRWSFRRRPKPRSADAKPRAKRTRSMPSSKPRRAEITKSSRPRAKATTRSLPPAAATPMPREKCFSSKNLRNWSSFRLRRSGISRSTRSRSGTAEARSTAKPPRPIFSAA